MSKRELQGLFVRFTKKQHKKLGEMSLENDISISSLVRTAVKKEYGVE